MNLLLGLLATITGMLMPVQVALNAGLREFLGQPLQAGLVNFLVGSLALVLLLTVLRVPLPSAGAVASVPVQNWLGGLIGVCVVVVSLVAGPRLGAGTLFTLIVTGQMLASVLFDHFGMLGYAERLLTPARALGTLMLVGGVVLIVRH